MRVGIDARLYGVASGTGIGRYVEELLRALAREPVPKDWEFAVFLRRDGYAAYTPPNARWSKVPADFRPYSLAAQTGFPGVIRAARIDLMHFTHFDHPLTYRGPFLTTVHDLILLNHPSIRASTLGPLRFWTKYAVYRRVIRHAAQRSIRILTPSRAVKDDVTERLGVPPEKIIPTPLGADHALRHERVASSDQRPASPYLLYVGNAYPHKNLEQLVRIAPTVECRHPDLRIVIVGKQDDFSKRLRGQLPERTPIVFHGPATENELHTLFVHARAYINVSRGEGFDLPCLEAQMLGVPVVASDIPVHREVLDNTATFVPINEDTALLDAIERTAVDNASRGTMKSSGMTNAARYTWERTARLTLSAYREIASIVCSKGPP